MAFPVREARVAEKYDGTNSAALNAAISDFTILAEDASGLTFTSDGEQHTVAPNGYVVWYQGKVTHVFQNEADYATVFVATSLDGHVHDLVLTSGPAKAAPQEA